MVRRTNSEEMVQCPVKGCDKEVVARGLYMHIFQSDDPEGEAHYPRYEEPPYLDMEDLKVTGETTVEMDFPEDVDLEDKMYLDTYTGKAYKGRRGLMIHLGQSAGEHNIPSDVTDRHEPDDFPIVDVDDDGNITEVHRYSRGDVPPIAPYLPWYDDKDEGYVQKAHIREFVEDIKDSRTGAASPEMIEEELLGR